MRIFFHCHKAGGSTVVDAALKSGMRLPDNHVNGLPFHDDGRRVRWSRMSNEDSFNLISRYRDQGVDLMCFEFDFPRWSVLNQLTELTFFTVLRDPMARAWSNYRYTMGRAKAKGIEPMTFDDWLDGSGLFRANDFYTRFFCRTDPSEHLTQSRCDSVIKKLATFACVAILERNNLAERLAPLGFDETAFGWKNAGDSGSPATASADHGQLPHFPTRQRWYRNNALDYALYAYFLNADVHRSRSASA